jgi:hypothetical protein
VRLVGVAEVERDARQVDGLAVVEPLGGLVEAEAFDDPFGVYAEVVAEQALQGAFAEAYGMTNGGTTPADGSTPSSTMNTGTPPM